MFLIRSRVFLVVGIDPACMRARSKYPREWCLLSANKNAQSIVRICRGKPKKSNVELFAYPCVFSRLTHKIPKESPDPSRERLGGGMGQPGGLRYIYMHSASGGLFQYLLTTLPEYPMYKPPFNPRILSKCCLHHSHVTLVTIRDQ